ncbi:hypothetical protein BURPS406E_G0487 [Burkholderia pseudomallei 406e]|uniref:Uncharacterized protein n=2 Tax=Burkholderia pseudomallei TaxID=28450 RepID=A0A0E1VUF1_BURPE|nr:hypothetical protein BURPS668_A1419 [Burkholderia pseudomallei 668]ABN94587.1 hypothetical protein BURPS1106A_A1337 [Burkholderia pseudomallei 1106a]ABO03004.1 hypothetical protein BMA10247_A1072 [Burkholderia mallei NCTC 10247]AFR19276.1 hypothetical protein BPC006_II1348 [Burkholderia pseudomallei BPC006]EBA49607.1 hypothetical protein BURPS305_5071 [Burkholderia pseudomallei 305]EDK55396.1 hypothetical protein BMAFMH_E0452 [Burkholderia mallei FMH]EDK61332.1 hypothetical protein BMAJHU_
MSERRLGTATQRSVRARRDRAGAHLAGKKKSTVLGYGAMRQ